MSTKAFLRDGQNRWEEEMLPRKPLRHLLISGIATVLASSIGVHAATTYTLAVLAKAGDTIGGKTLTFVGFPTINDSGTSTFLGVFAGGQGYFTPSSLVVQTGDAIGGRTLTFLDNPAAINNGGTLGFHAHFSGGEGIFMLDRLLVQTGDTIAGQTVQAFGLPGINSSGTVAFYATCGTHCAGVFTPSALLAAPGFTIGGKTLTSTSFNQGAPIITPISDDGTAIFYASFDGGVGIFTQSNLVAATGDTIDGRTLTNVGVFPAISHNGAIAFLGEFAGGKGIFTPSSLVAQTGDTIGGRTLTDIDPFSLVINDTGTILFFGSFAGGRGIFTQSALVAQTGDVIDGKTLVGPFFFPAMNDRGAIVFDAQFTDGSPGIVLAQPPMMTFAGTPGQANCHGQSVAALTRQFGGLDAAASVLGFASVRELHEAIGSFCEE
jgi:hypothetical protein